MIGPLIGYLLVFLIAANRNSPSAEDFTRIFLWASVPAFAAVLVAAFFMRECNCSDTLAGPSIGPPRLSLSGFDANFKQFLIS